MDYNTQNRRTYIEDRNWTGCPKSKSLAGLAILVGLLLVLILK